MTKSFTHLITAPLTTATVRDHMHSLRALVHTNHTLVLDLSKLPNIDSAGIAALLELTQIAHKNNHHLVITNSPDCLVRLCELYKITL